MKKIIPLLLLCLLLMPFFTTNALVDDDDSFSLQTSESVGVGASEEEEIDTFNNWPGYRWNIVKETGVTDTINNGMYKITDTGDNTHDYIQLDRNLTKMEDKVEILFEYTFDSGVSEYDYIEFFICNDDGLTDDIGVKIYDEGDIRVYYEDVGGNRQYEVQDETLESGKRYVLTFDFSIRKSEFSVTLDYENGTDVFDKDWFDIGATTPEIFTEYQLRMGMYYNCYLSPKTTTLEIDYIMAPFRVNQWFQRELQTDATFDISTPTYAHAEDNVNDLSRWDMSLTDPDSVNAFMTLKHNQGTWGSSDVMYQYFQIYGVDYDDGDLHSIVVVRMQLDYYGSGNPVAYAHVVIDGGYTQTFSGNPSVDDEYVEARISVDFSEDRDQLTLKCDFGTQSIDLDNEEYFQYTFDVDDFGTDIKNEFLFEHVVYFDFDGDIEGEAYLSEFDLTRKDIFTDIIRPILDPLFAIFNFIFTTIGMFLAGIFKVVGDALAGVFVFVGDVLGLAIGLVQTAIESLWTSLETVLSDFWTILETIVADMITAIDTFLEDTMPSIVTWLFSGLALILTTIIDFIADIGFGLYDAFWLLFGVDPAPDFLEMFNYLASNLGQGIADLITIIGTIVDIYVWWLFLPYYILLGYWLYFFISPALMEGSVLTYPIGLIKNAVQTIEILTVPIPPFVIFAGLTFVAYVGGL